MRHWKCTGLLALLIALALTLSGCSLLEPHAPDYTQGDNAAFVQAVARAVTLRVDDPSLFDAGEYPIRYDLETEPSLQPWIAMLNFRATVDEDDPSLVHYSCKIPGVVGSCFNMAYGVCFVANEAYSKWVEMEGDVRVLTEEDGSRRIDISGGDNAFAAYAALRYVNPLFFSLKGIDISKGIPDEKYADGLNILLNRGCEAYADALGVDTQEYADTVVIPELKEYQNHIATIARASTCQGYGFWNSFYGTSTTVKILGLAVAALAVIGILWGLIRLIVRSIKNRKEKEKKKPRIHLPKDIISNNLSAALLLDGLSEKAVDVRGRTYRDFCERTEGYKNFPDLKEVRAAAKMAAVLAQKPEEQKNDSLRLLCKMIHLGLHADSMPVPDGVNAEAYRRELLTAAGWAAAALGRTIVKKLSPGDIAGCMERLPRAMDKSNETVGKLRESYEERKKLGLRIKALEAGAETEAFDGTVSRMGEINALVEKYKRINETVDALELEFSKGLGGYILENGDLPLGLLVFLLRDSQNRFPRFIKQGAIMGLVDWLVDHRSHPEAGKLLETVVAVRKELICSDNELTFFEVRAPYGCTRKDYAVLLADVLHCANPSAQYGSAEELLSIAEKEIPGVMDMLYACPLRLIDPANQRSLGFYKMKPYVHAMWVQYTPPLHTGHVISRYHEVDDRTKPLSSGLNLHLFRDCYAVIPTLFHEYQHFKGDRNEASVFLKTQLFSIAFYKKYKEADDKADGVFTRLTTLLGLPPAADKREQLNALIRQYYGQQMSEQAAEELANAEIAGINRFVDQANANETWDPEVKMPRLNAVEDKKNHALIRDIVIRFATVPKSVTAEEFDEILSGKAQTLPELAGLPFSASMEAIANKLGTKEGVDMWLHHILAIAMDHDAGRSGVDASEAEAISFLMRKNGLDVTNSKLKLQELVFDHAAHDPKSLPDYLRKAAARAREEEDTAVRPQHLLFALLKKPTATMRNAGVVPKKK